VSIASLHSLDQNWEWFRGHSSVRVQILFSERPNNPLSAFAQLIKATLKLRDLIKKKDAQIVYSAQGVIAYFIAWLAVSRMLNTKLVWSARAGGSKKGDCIGWKSTLLYHLCKWVSASVPLLISNSEAGGANLKTKGYRCQRNVVIFNGIDIDQFCPDLEARKRVRNEWGVPKNNKLIGLIARSDPLKGHFVFLRAAALLMNELTDVDFVCIGPSSQPYQSQIQLMSHKLGLTKRLIWAGERKDMTDVYNALDIVCSSSYSEGFPNVLGEAMACGVPCVVTGVGDSAKIIGDMGVVVPPGDPKILAKGLKTMLLGLHGVKPQLLRDRILEHFRIETMVEATERILAETHNDAKGSLWNTNRRGA